MEKRSELARALLAGDRFVILTHRRPDGDTIGSAAALCRILRALGKQSWILENPQRTARYDPFWAGLTTDTLPEESTLVSVDTASPDMLPEVPIDFTGRVALAIDHHETNTGYAALTWVQPDYAAAGELIYELALELGVALDKSASEALYLAVSTDTGGFLYSNTTAHTFACAAACCAAGADIFPINRSFFTVKTFSRAKTEAFLMEHLQRFDGGRICIAALSRADIAALGATEDDLDSISSFLRTIEGVELGVMIRELDDGSGKLSLRSGERISSSALCRQLGGGGHAAAAGATVAGGIEAARNAILRVLADAGLLN